MNLTNEIIHNKATPTTSLDNIGSLFLSMIQIMEENNGVGLAAPQIGVPKRIFIMRKKWRNTNVH